VKRVENGDHRRFRSVAWRRARGKGSPVCEKLRWLRASGLLPRTEDQAP